MVNKMKDVRNKKKNMLSNDYKFFFLKQSNSLLDAHISIVAYSLLSYLEINFEFLNLLNK